MAPTAILYASWGDNPSQPAATSGRGRVSRGVGGGGSGGGGMKGVWRWSAEIRHKERAVGVGKEDIKF